MKYEEEYALIDTITKLTHFTATKSPTKMLKQEQTVQICISNSHERI